MSFRRMALTGYAVVTLLLTGGMAATIERLDRAAVAQTEQLRAVEAQITLAERLRYQGELVVSAGRGYLIGANPDLRVGLAAAAADFDATARVLESHRLSSQGGSLLAAVELAADEFVRAQRSLVNARPEAADAQSLAHRFEEELVPRAADLSAALDRMVEQNQADLGAAYEAARNQRAQLTGWMNGLLAMLLVAGFGVSFYFARLLTRSYRKERDALEAARRALAARDEMMGIVAHDLRNPLGAIALRATLLRKRADSEPIRTHAESIVAITTCMGNLIKSLLDVASIEAGRLTVAPSACDAATLVREGIDLMGGLLDSKRIHPAVRFAATGLAVRADRERVLQVLSNLLGNAIKFTPEGGDVAISVARDGEMIRFTIADSGPGIHPEHQAHVFERYWKHETQGAKGTGLGLFIARSLVDAHGGRIWIESQPGRGATFHFTIPSAELAGAAVAAAS